MSIELKAFDPAEYLDDPESLAAYLEDALGDGDPGEFLEALGVVARAKGMTELAKSAKVARPALYRSLTATGHPDFNTVLSILRSVGVSMHVHPTRAVAAKSARTIAKRANRKDPSGAAQVATVGTQSTNARPRIRVTRSSTA